MLRNIHTWLVLGVMALLASACSAPGPTCVGAGDFGDVSTTTVEVDSRSSAWVNANISVISGDSKVQIEVLPSSLMLCGKDEQSVNLNSNNPDWTDTNIYVQRNDQLFLTTNHPSATKPSSGSEPFAGKYNRWGDEPWDNANPRLCTDSITTQCWSTEGWGLMAKIGGSQSHNHCNTTDTSDCTAPDVFLLPGKDEFSHATNKGMAEYNGLPLDTSGLLPGKQKLWVSVIDEAGTHGDNRGGYIVNITRYGCPRYNGENMRAYIGTDAPSASQAFSDTVDLGPSSAGYNQTVTATRTGNIWLKIFDLPPTDPDYDKAPGDGDYGVNSNEGKYTVKITVVTSPRAISNAIKYLIDGRDSNLPKEQQALSQLGVKGALEVAREKVYNVLITSTAARIVKAMLALYIVIYGIMFMYGMIENTQMDFVIRVIKIAIIIQLISQGSWDFFNTYFFSAFVDGTSYLIHVMSNAYAPTNVAWKAGQPIEWTFLDQTFSRLFAQTTWIKIAGLLFAFPFGWIYLIVIVWGMGLYIVSVALVILSYMLSLVAVALLLALAPIFIAFLLFKGTSELFKRWLNELFAYSIQPVIMIALLVIFNFFVIASLFRVLNFSVCWKCIWSVNVGFEMCLLKFYVPNGWVSEFPITSMPITVMDIVIFIIFVKMMPKALQYSERTAKRLASTSAQISLLGMSKGVTDSAGQAAKSLVGMDKKSVQRRKDTAAHDKLVKRAGKELAAEDKAKEKAEDKDSGKPDEKETGKDTKDDKDAKDDKDTKDDKDSKTSTDTDNKTPEDDKKGGTIVLDD